MPKLGMAPIRRQQLIDATIAAIGDSGFSNITVSRISQVAGVSAGIIHHYFGGKNELLEAAMRSLLRDLHAQTLAHLAGLHDSESRVRAIIDANFTPSQFSPQAVTAWLAFWSQAPYIPALRRLQRVNAARLQSNLLVELRRLLPDPEAKRTAAWVSALIDGLSLRSALAGGSLDGEAARALVHAQLDCILARSADSH